MNEAHPHTRWLLDVPEAARTPAFLAAEGPPFDRWMNTSSLRATIGASSSAVPSVDPSSTMMISSRGHFWARTEARASGR